MGIKKNKGETTGIEKNIEFDVDAEWIAEVKPSSRKRSTWLRWVRWLAIGIIGIIGIVLLGTMMFSQ